MSSMSNKTKWLFLALLSIILSWATYAIFYDTHIENEQTRFQKDFSELEKRQLAFKESLTKVVKSSTTEDLWSLSELQKNKFSIHILRNDSLVYWNNNQINIESDF